MQKNDENTLCQDCSEQEQIEQIFNIIDFYKASSNNLIQILHAAQQIYGYLPLKIQSLIAEKMKLPISQVSGVVTFYSFFSTKPKGKHTILICLGTACYVRGGKKILEKLQQVLNVELGGTTADRRFTLDVARCIGACSIAPAIMIDNTVYKFVSPDNVEAILSSY